MPEDYKGSGNMDKQAKIAALNQKIADASHTLETTRAGTAEWIDASNDRKKAQDEIEALMAPPALKRPAMSGAQVIESMGRRIDELIKESKEKQ